MKENKKKLFEYIRDIYLMKTKVITNYLNYERNFNIKKLEDKYSKIIKFKSYTDELEKEDESIVLTYIKEYEKIPEIPKELKEYVEIVNEELNVIKDITEDVKEKIDLLKQEIDEIKEKNKLIDSYNDLYKYFYELKRRIDEYEEKIDIIYANGLLIYKQESAKGILEIKRHIFEASIDIEINNITNTIKLKIDREQECKLETEFLNCINGFKIKSQEDFDELLNKVRNNFVEIEELEFDEIIESYLNSITFKYDYCKEGLTENIENNKFYVVNSSDILIRRKQPKVWIDDLNNILDFFDEEGDFESENKILDLLLENDDEKIDELITDTSTVLDDILFPLPANEEQERVVNQLQNSNLVLVQGPPGTGKSHTIANLISAYVAKGKKVLITSEKSKALDVIRDKLPEEIRNLSMTVLSEKDNNNDLEISIAKVLEKFKDKAYLDSYRKKIEALKNNLKDNNQRKVQNQKDILDILVRNTKNYENELKSDVALSSYMLSDLAEYLAQNIQYDYIEDINDFSEIKFNLEYLNELNLIANNITDNNYILNNLLPARFDLEEYKSAIENLNLLEKNYNEISKSYDVNTSYVQMIEKDVIKELIEELKKLNKIIDFAFLNKNKNYQPFLENVLKIIKFLEEKKEFVENAEVTLYGVKINYTSKIDHLYECVDIILKLLEKGKKIGIIEKIKFKEQLNLIYKIKFDGSELTENTLNIEILKKIILKLEYDKTIFKAKEMLNRCFGENLTITIDTTEFSRNIKEILSNLYSIYYFDKKQNALEMHFSMIFNNNKAVCDIVENYEYDKLFLLLKNAEDYTIYFNELINYKNKIVKLKNEIAKSEKIFEEFVNAFVIKNIEKLEVEIKKINNVFDLNEKYIALQDKFKFENTYYKKFIFKFISMNEENRINIIENYNKIMNYYKVKMLFLTEEKKNSKFNKLLEIKRELQKEEKKIILLLLEQEAWYYQISNMTNTMAKALSTWASLKKKYGKGTGKKANLIKRDMQLQMQIAKDAIPIWIMPVDKVVEQYPICKKPQFDLVIMDESSQSSITAISALYRGNKNVIVGDDKQISPIVVGVEIQSLQELQNKYLKATNLGAFLDNETSIYDFAQAVCGSRKVVLKEHFRCLPEIIDFSSKHFYGNDINCLKVRNKENTIKQAIRLEYVPNGTIRKTASSILNEKEVDRIIDVLQEIYENEEYSNKSVGIVTLQNSKPQIDFIKNAIFTNFSPKFVNERKIRVGNPYDFQGDERDVIILSMIQSKIKDNGDENIIMPMTKKEFEKSINVAASRAKEQVILVHSVKLEELNPNDLRYKLLHYYSTYNKEKEIEHEKLFESNFEKDVYNFFKSQNINLIPQYKVGKYRLDFMVENEKGVKVAIECDGDIYHSLEDYEKDIDRQNVLERCGWSFIRVRASQYYYDNETTQKIMLEKLNDILDISKPIINNSIKSIEKITDNTRYKTQEVKDNKTENYSLFEENLTEMNELQLFVDNQLKGNDCKELMQKIIKDNNYSSIMDIRKWNYLGIINYEISEDIVREIINLLSKIDYKYSNEFINNILTTNELLDKIKNESTYFYKILEENNINNQNIKNANLLNLLDNEKKIIFLTRYFKKYFII